MICENGCGSPTYGYSKLKWIFESNRFEMRVVADGCGCTQSKEYSYKLMNGEIDFPIYSIYGDWVYPQEEGYHEAIHYSQCEKLLSIRGLPEKETIVHKPRLYA